ncbi:hypothetical protein BD410DRAFT_831221 [Rickenella mellea]|uniref:Uncharacterized protein n=1 Tax=Rickenella mellea TaxID=50990 RepID=A0A4Y7PSB8_9AGAM|nr:hypothetical protein BD410DRAFT_831221 [Rickenella mellea]
MENAANLATSIAHRLPDDILEMIFLSCLPQSNREHHDYVAFPYPSPCEAPMICGQTCRSWRDLALSSPRLWSRLGIYLPEKFKSFVWIKEWLRRSQSVPLYFNWTPSPTSIYGQMDYQSDRTVTAAMKLLLAESKRWHQVHIGDGGKILQQLLAALKYGVPMLATLQVYHRGLDWQQGDFCVDITAAPRLQYLNVTSVFRLTDISATHGLRQFIMKETPCWSTSWSRSFMSTSGILQLFSACPTLELVDIHILEPGVVLPPRQVIMPSLRQLSLRFASYVHHIEM